MPKRKAAPSLKSVCMSVVSRHLEHFFCIHYVEEYEISYIDATHEEVVEIEKRVRPIVSEGPFDIIPRNLKEDLVEYLRSNDNLHKHSLELILLDNSAKEIRLNGWTGNISGFIEDLGAQFRNLSTLDISNCDLQLRALLQLPDHIPNIISLNLSHNKCCGDGLLPLLSKNCAKLRQLFLYDSSITDEGLTNFVLGADGCQPPPLTHLDIRNSKTSHMGAYHALVNLKQLVDLKHHDTISVFKVFKLKSKIKRGKRFAITTMNGGSWNIRSDDPETALLVVEGCPLIERLDIIKALPEVLIVLSRFERLKSCYFHQQIEISSLRDFLELRGSLLSDVKLRGSTAHFKSLSLFCPNLKRLEFHFDRCADQLELIPWPDNPFPELTNLFIDAFEGIESFDLISALSGCFKLESLTVYGAECLTDCAFDRVLDSNPFAFLNKIEIYACNNLTIKSVEKLLLSHRVVDLKSLECTYCENVSREDFKRMQKYCKERNFDIQLVYKDYSDDDFICCA